MSLDQYGGHKLESRPAFDDGEGGHLQYRASDVS